MPNANRKQDRQLISLMAQAENPSIETRDQFREEQTNPNNLYMAPGWSAIMVQDIIYNMAEFAARKCEGWDDNEDWDYTTENPEITDAEMEQIAPGITQQVTEIMARHIPSDQMYLAIYAEAREFAQTAVNEMDPEDQVALVNAARKKVHKARARKENG